MSLQVSDLIFKFQDGTPVYIIKDNQYLSISAMGQVSFKPKKDDAEKFRMIKKGKNKFALLTEDEKYITAFRDRIRENGEEPLRQQTFKVQGSSIKNVTMFSAFLGYYLSLDKDGDPAFCTDDPKKAISICIEPVF